MNPSDWKLGLGRYSHYRYTFDTEINRYVSIGSSCRADKDEGDRHPPPQNKKEQKEKQNKNTKKPTRKRLLSEQNCDTKHVIVLL